MSRKTICPVSMTRVAAVALAAVFALSGCAGQNNDASKTADSTSEPQYGGVLNWATKDEPGNGGLDPLVTTVFSSTGILNQIYEPLIVKSDAGELEPWLAEDFKQQDDLHYEVTLRDGVKFADGSELTASDVVWNFEYVKEHSPQSKADALEHLQEVKDEGGGRISFVFDEPNPSFLYSLSDRTYGFYIVDQQWYEQSDDKTRQTSSNGTGPFALDSWTQGVDVKLVRNDNYWQKGKPYLEGITFTKAPDENSILALLQQGQADAGWFWNADLAQQAKDAGLTLGKLQQTSTRFLYFDPNKSEALADINIRQAFSKAINREELVELGTQGRGAITFATPPGFAEIETPTDATPNYKFDLEGAKQLVAKSSVSNPTISLAFDAETSDRAVLELIQQQLGKAGITLELKPLPYSEIQAVFTTGDEYPAEAILVQDVIGADPAGSFTWWLKTGSNVDRWGDDEQAAKAKQLLEEITTNTDTTERVDQINELNTEIAEQALTITPWVTPLDYQLWSDKVHGYTTDPNDSRWHLQDAWLS